VFDHGAVTRGTDGLRRRYHVNSARLRILVVDDSEQLLEMYEALLGARYSVKTATNADDAFATVRDWRPEILLTDVSMPGRTGLDLITQIRSDLAPPLPHIGVITGFPEFEAGARDRGASAVLLKPFDLETLEAVIRDLSGRVTTSSPLRERALERRAAATREAERFVDEFLAANPDAEAMTAHSARRVARYFGSSTVLVLLLRAGRLRVFASSDPGFPNGTEVDHSLGRAAGSVLASGATLFVSEDGLLADLGEVPASEQRLVACAAARSPAGDPVAGFAILSARGCTLDVRDLPIVEDLAHHVEEVLAGRREARSARLGSADLVRHVIWGHLLERELQRLRDDLSICVCLAHVTSTADLDQHLDPEAFAALGDHSAVAMRHDGRIGLFKRSHDPRAAEDAVRLGLETIDRALGVRLAATLTIVGVAPPKTSEAVLAILEGLLTTAPTPEPGSVVAATLSARAERVA
jgi:CheY-like chemotaxis protein